jgi:ubiquinone/menaquinone biosynthesis C-methylase UbiE
VPSAASIPCIFPGAIKVREAGSMTSEPETEAIKQRLVGLFGCISTRYDAQRATANASAPLIAAAKSHPGGAVLDIATGTGTIALSLAKDGSSVMGIDLTEGMVEVASAKAAEQGLSNASFSVGDAEKLGFPDATFDTVTCGLGIFFLPNQQQALLEWKRVLKPGGWVHFTVFGEGSAQPHGRMLREQIAKYGVDARSIFVSPLPKIEDCQRVLEEAGFTNIETTRVDQSFYQKDLQEYWIEARNAVGGALSAQLSEEQQRAFAEEHLAAVAETATPEGIYRKSIVNLASGQKPTA